MKINIDEVAARISTSPDRERIEDALEELYGVRDIRRVEDETLRTFVRFVLPALSPVTFGRRRRDRDV